MTIGDILHHKNRDTYKRLLQIEKEKPKKKDIQLGDSVENLMSADGHKRIKGTIKQTRWGK